MQLIDRPFVSNPEAQYPSLRSAQSPSGRWQLNAILLPSQKAAVSFWMLQDHGPSLLRRWELPGAHAAQAFFVKLKHLVAPLPDDAKPSQVLALLPLQATPSTGHRDRSRRQEPVRRLSGA